MPSGEPFGQSFHRSAIKKPSAVCAADGLSFQYVSACAAFSSRAGSQPSEPAQTAAPTGPGSSKCTSRPAAIKDAGNGCRRYCIGQLWRRHAGHGRTGAPAEAMIVVSEIGEQWSPHTAPAIRTRQCTMPMGSSGEDRHGDGDEPRDVPQLVPVAKASGQPIRNTMAGRNICMPPSAPLFKVPHKIFRAQKIRRGFRRPCECEDHNGRHHRLKAVRMQPIISERTFARRSI